MVDTIDSKLMTSYEVWRFESSSRQLKIFWKILDLTNPKFINMQVIACGICRQDSSVGRVVVWKTIGHQFKSGSWQLKKDFCQVYRASLRDVKLFRKAPKSWCEHPLLRPRTFTLFAFNQWNNTSSIGQGRSLLRGSVPGPIGKPNLLAFLKNLKCSWWDSNPYVKNISS